MNGLHSNHSNPPFTEHVDHNFVPPPPTSPTKTLLLTSIQTDAVFRTEEPKRIKLCLRENQWPANHEIRKVLWSKFYKIRLKEYQSDHEASIYQDVVKEVFGDGKSRSPAILYPWNKSSYVHGKFRYRVQDSPFWLSSACKGGTLMPVREFASTETSIGTPMIKYLEPIMNISC